MPNWPEGYVVAGDACCILNPAYGLGMTAAVRSATVMQRMLGLGRPQRRFARRFQTALANQLVTPWLITTEEPLWTGSPAKPASGYLRKLQKRYYRAISEVSNSDEEVWGVLQEVVQLARPPRDLFRPSIMIKAMLGPNRLSRARRGPVHI